MNLKEQEDLLLKVEKAKEQIARLRAQQAELEREKIELEELKGKQEEWYRGRQEIEGALLRAVGVLENEETEVSKMAELVRQARETFSALLDQIASVREDRWTPGTLKEELQKAILIIQKGRNELGAARARIPALDRSLSGKSPAVGVEMTRIPAQPGSCCASELVKIGFWVALPAALMAVVIIIIFSIL